MLYRHGYGTREREGGLWQGGLLVSFPRLPREGEGETRQRAFALSGQCQRWCPRSKTEGLCGSSATRAYGSSHSARACSNTRQQKKAGGCGGWRLEGRRQKEKGLAGAGPLVVFLRRCALLGRSRQIEVLPPFSSPQKQKRGNGPL